MLTVKQHFKNLIVAGKIGEVLSGMMQKTEENSQKDLNEELLLLSARFNRNEGQKRQGLIEDRDYEISINRITYTLKEYVEQLKGGDKPHRDSEDTPLEPVSTASTTKEEKKEIPDRFVPLPPRQPAKFKYIEKSPEEIEALIAKGIILLVTATDTETRALHQKMIPLPHDPHLVEFIHENAIYYIGKFGRYLVAHVESGMGTGTTTGAIVTVTDAIQALKPKFVLMVGIAFGLDEAKQNIGDVLVSNQILIYESQKKAADQTIHRGSRPEASIPLRNRFKNLRDWEYILPNGEEATLELCDILTGEKLIDNLEFRDELAEQFPTAKGGEMEGAGLYVACTNRRVDWIMVKSICDFADGNKSANKKEKQALAIETATDACLHLFNKKGFEALGVTVFEEYS